MSPRLTSEQLNDIIAEAQRLQTRREQQLEPEQVQQILEELNLSPDLLDEAMTQVHRRRALEAENRRNKFVFGGVAAALVMIIGCGIFFFQQKNATLASVSIQQERITELQDNGSSLKFVERQKNPELFYRVTLKDAPVGQKLNLSCNWIDSSGQVVKQNRYQTKDITTPVWDTHCKYILNPGANVGNWKVQMLLDGRLLGDENFEVK